jgi:outer membrane protein OmpA-like peptidoglycan-associated protein
VTSDGSEHAAAPPGTDPAAPEDRAAEFARLRELLVGRERDALAELRERVDALEDRPDAVAAHLPEAVALRAGRDEQLARALGPTLERAFSESVRRNPHHLAQAIYPALGPAIRKAIAEAIAGLVTTINRALDESLSVRGLRWRWEAWRSGVPYAQIVMKHALVYRVEQVYLIHAETGLLLAHVTAPDLTAPDADVISGMLTAIRDFVGDSFEPRGDGGLQKFTVGEVTVLVEAGPRALLAAAVRGQHPPALLLRMQETLELLHLHFAGPLAQFDGDAAALAPATPILADCLETVVETDRPRRQRLAPRIAWGVAALLVLALVGTAVLSQRRWARALRALEAEPGIVVLEAERGWRSRRIAGLRDPMAADPAAVLVAAGGDTTRLTGVWRPYVSTEPRIALARARRVLATPASVHLRLVGDTLVATGAAPADWLARARARADAIAGVSMWRDDDVTPELPARLREAAASLARTRVLFAAGSADLSDAALRSVLDAADLWRLIQTGVGADWVVRLDVVGRTDSTGSLEANQMLSGERASRVTRALGRLGLPPGVLHPDGIGTSAPLPARELDTRARLNRSVSFGIRLEPASPHQEPRP